MCALDECMRDVGVCVHIHFYVYYMMHTFQRIVDQCVCVYPLLRVLHDAHFSETSRPVCVHVCVCVCVYVCVYITLTVCQCGVEVGGGRGG